MDLMEFNKQEFIKVFNNWIDNKSGNSVYYKILDKLYSDISRLLSKRFIKMQNSICFDTKLNAYWIGVCDKDFKYYRSFSNTKKPYRITSLVRDYYKNFNLNIPTKDEILSLIDSKVYKNLPEKLLFRSNGHYYYFTTKTIKSFPSMLFFKNFENIYIYNASGKTNLPIIPIRYFKSYGFNKKKIISLWLNEKLNPLKLDNQFYKFLLDLDIEIRNFYITLINGDINKKIRVKNIKPKQEKQMLKKDNLLEELRKVDFVRCDLEPYNSKIFTDINQGSWEVFKRLNEDDKSVVDYIPRDPKEDIKQGGIVAIDFGTKSTVVVCLDDENHPKPLRIGTGKLKSQINKNDFENPTIMEFIDFKNFLKDYKAQDFRPYTKWNDLTISHTAYNNMNNCHFEDINSFVTELKMWAGDNKRTIKIQDKKNKEIFELKRFMEVAKNDLNPIEIYAYYLGLYINNQHNGIFLQYILSFPVTYEKEIREKIRKSFEKGLKKSIPDIGEKIEDIRVFNGISEPTAYACVVLGEYFDNDEDIEEAYYGIFDFGGGTTDFDFGLFRVSDEDNRKESNYDYVIEHFGMGGDRYLGGENLLELLSFEIFKNNKDILLEKGFSFTKYPEGNIPVGFEALIKDSREAKLNTSNLVNKLRKFWERENFDEEIFKEGEIQVNLFDEDGKLISNVALKIDEKELKDILYKRIEKGVKSFFSSLTKYFQDIDNIKIFLAGNSSKSPILKEIFNEYISKFQEKNGIKIELNLPLDNENDYAKPNGKTGVAFGLLESRDGGDRVLIKSLQKENPKFRFYIGKAKRKKFNVVIDKDINYNEWIEFRPAIDEFFEIYYSESDLVIGNKLSISDKEIKKKMLKINKSKITDDSNIYIRLISTTKIEYGVGSSEDDIEDIVEVEL